MTVRANERGFVLKSRSFARSAFPQPPTKLMHVRSVTRVFHTCGKNCGKSPRKADPAVDLAQKSCESRDFGPGEYSTKTCSFEPK